MDTVTLTSEMIMAGASKAGGFTKVQLAALGLEPEFKSGWKRKIEGTVIPLENYNKFLKLKGVSKDPDGPIMLPARGSTHKLDHTMPMDLGL